MASNIIKIGSKVKYRGGFGMDKPTEVTIKYIEKAKNKREKYGEPVDEVPFKEREYCTFDLDNGHWCYGEQIDEIVADPEPEKFNIGDKVQLKKRPDVIVKITDIIAEDVYETTTKSNQHLRLNSSDFVHYYDPEPEKEYRVSFRAEVYVKGKDLKSAREQFEDIPIFSADALEDYGAEFIELESVERVDDESYEEVTTAFKRS